jgi:hypothetical protein
LQNSRRDFATKRSRCGSDFDELRATRSARSDARAEDSRHCAAPPPAEKFHRNWAGLLLRHVLSLHDNFGAAFQFSNLVLLNAMTRWARGNIYLEMKMAGVISL